MPFSFADCEVLEWWQVKAFLADPSAFVVEAAPAAGGGGAAAEEKTEAKPVEEEEEEEDDVRTPCYLPYCANVMLWCVFGLKVGFEGVEESLSILLIFVVVLQDMGFSLFD